MQAERDNLEVLTEQEMEQIILAFAASRGDRGITTAETATLLHEANLYKAMWMMFQMAMKHELKVDILNDEVAFRSLATE